MWYNTSQDSRYRDEGRDAAVLDEGGERDRAGDGAQPTAHQEGGHGHHSEVKQSFHVQRLLAARMVSSHTSWTKRSTKRSKQNSQMLSEQYISGYRECRLQLAVTSS